MSTGQCWLSAGCMLAAGIQPALGQHCPGVQNSAGTVLAASIEPVLPPALGQYFFVNWGGINLPKFLSRYQTSNLGNLP